MNSNLNTIKDYYDRVTLGNDDREYNLKVKILLMYFNNIDTFGDLTLHFNDEMKNGPLFINGLNRIKKGEPVQYVIGETQFLDAVFKVTEDVLIPRPETEELVNLVSEYLENQENKKIRIVDVGTGSGVIGVSLKRKYPEANVICTDISKKALKIAKENADNLSTNVVFYEGDKLKPLIDRGIKVDMIVSNPPYIKSGDVVDEQVVKYEPHFALFDDNYEFFSYLFNNAYKVFNERGIIFLEVSEDHAEEIKRNAICINNFAKVELIKDLEGKNRFIKIQYENKNS
jgi:release factor glutamine methyltransferase